MSEASLSVVVPCHDFEPFVGPCLESLAPVGRAGGEIIVVDDRSSDGSLEAIEGWMAGYDGRARTISHPDNRGAPATFNTGLEAATAPLICYVDADDLVDSGALIRQAELMAESPSDVVVVFGDAEQIDEHGEQLPGKALDWMRSLGGPFTDDVRAELAIHGSVCPLLGTVVRTSDVRAVGGFDETLHFCDWPLWLKLAPRGRFVFSGEIVGQYRRHGRSMSRDRRDQLDHDRLLLLARIAGDPGFHDQKTEIGTHVGRLVSSMAGRDNRPSLGDGLTAARRLRRPRVAAQVIRAWVASSAGASTSSAGPS